MNKVEITVWIGIVLAIAFVAFVVFFYPEKTPTSTLPHCSQATLDEVAREKADALKGIHTYSVVENCQELHQ